MRSLVVVTMVMVASVAGVLAQAPAQGPARGGGQPVQPIQMVKPGLYVVPGGGSNSIGTFIPFVDDPVELIGVEAGGEGLDSGRHGASLVAGAAQCSPGPAGVPRQMKPIRWSWGSPSGCSITFGSAAW